jgi:serine/threonine protein kinase, bacterial
MNCRSTTFLALIVGVLALVSCGPGSRNATGPVVGPTTTRPAEQSVLSIPGVSQPEGLAVGPTGDLYLVSNQGVLHYVSGATTDLPLGSGGADVAVDQTGRVYLADYVDGKVLALAPGAQDPAELPFGRLEKPNAIAVDNAGDVYVADARNRVLKLAQNATSPTQLPFGDIKTSFGVATDRSGSVYATDPYNNRVLKLTSGSASAVELPFGGVKGPTGIAVDNAGSVYVTFYGGGGKVLKLAAGTTNATELPFTGLQKPWGIAIDTNGSVYVADHGANQVLKLTVR